MIRFVRWLAPVLFLLSASVGGAQAQPQRPLVVFAAASLQTALNQIGRDWTARTGKPVTFSYAASSVLARQVEQGAPADVLASADAEWMDWLEQRKLVRAGTRRTFLGNALVLIAGADVASDLKIAPGFRLAEAIGDSRLATGLIQSVPVGRYAQSALTALGVWDSVAPRLVGTDNVRSALTLVARGEARFGIVYATDARVEPRVRVVDTFPPGLHPPVVYPFAIPSGSTHADAGEFLAYLSSDEARQRFVAQGFSILR